LAELIIGSQGYLFSFAIGGLALSVRIGIFIAVIGASLYWCYKDKQISILKSSYLKPFTLLAIVFFWAFINGVLSGNGWGNVFFDANGYVFFALALPIWQAIKSKKDITLLLEVSVAALTTSVLKVLWVLYMFSHKFWWALPEVYRWIRDTRVGEITIQVEPFYRIFLQSQLYALFAYFIVAVLLVLLMKKGGVKSLLTNTLTRRWLYFFVLIISTIIISLSRSFWLGAFVSFIAMCGVYFYSLDKPGKAVFNIINASIIGTLFSLILITFVAIVPFPPSGARFSTGSLIKDRFKSEEAVSSRGTYYPHYGRNKRSLVLRIRVW